MLLRPIVEDYLLPTLAYTGGAAEIAYFAQAGAGLRSASRSRDSDPSALFRHPVEPKMQRLLERHGIGLSLTDAFEGPEGSAKATRCRPSAQRFAGGIRGGRETLWTRNFSSVKEKLEKLDSTLVDAAETARSKMQHQLETSVFAGRARGGAKRENWSAATPKF